MIGDLVTTIFNLFLIIILTTIVLFLIYTLARTFVIIVRNDIRKRRVRKLTRCSKLNTEEESK